MQFSEIDWRKSLRTMKQDSGFSWASQNRVFISIRRFSGKNVSNQHNWVQEFSRRNNVLVSTAFLINWCVHQTYRPDGSAPQNCSTFLYLESESTSISFMDGHQQQRPKSNKLPAQCLSLKVQRHFVCQYLIWEEKRYKAKPIHPINRSRIKLRLKVFTLNRSNGKKALFPRRGETQNVGLSKRQKADGSSTMVPAVLI